MDPLSIPVAMLTIMMRRIIDSFYRAPVPKNLGSSVVSSNYSAYTYTILAAALWFFYSQFTKRGLTCPKTPLMAIEGGPASKNNDSDQTTKPKNTDKTTQKKESCQCMQRIDASKRKKKRPSACLKFVMKRCSKTVYYAKTSANGIARCSSYSDSQFFAKHFKGLTARSLSSSSSEHNIRTTSRKRRVRIIQWKFEGEPVAKKTRSGRIYGYINLLKY